MFKIKHRFNIIIILFLCIFLIIFYQLFNLQIINGAKYEDESQHKLLKNRRIIAPRGIIYDCNEIPLATNQVSYFVEITKTSQNENQLNSMLLKLVNIFEKNNDHYKNSLANYLTYNPIKFGEYLKDKSSLSRWKNDLSINKNNYKKIQTAEHIFKYLRKKFHISNKYTHEEAYKVMTLRYEILIKGYSILDSLLLANNVSLPSIAEIEERHHCFPGVSTGIEPKRKYLQSNVIGHITGYISNLNSDEYIKLKDSGYYMTDSIGKLGIEQYAENELRGKDGKKSLEVDIWGKQFKELKSKPAIPGKNVTLTLDLNLQKVAYESLINTINKIRTSNEGGSLNKHDTYFGSVVAVDVNNGGILAMASYPSFDPAIFLADSNNSAAQNAIAALYDPKNKETSQYNRAISGTYPPGSTYKPLVGLIGLEEGIINKASLINDPGLMYIEGTKLTCLEWRQGKGAHGNLTLKDGLKTSCNMFFYKLGMLIGINKIDYWAKRFGFGEKTGIELYGEQAGIRANPQYHQKINSYKFGKVLTAHASIGQSYHLYSPLQLASYVCTLANKGKKYKMHLIKSIGDNAGTKVKQTKIEFEQIPIKKENFNIAEDGMIAVTTSGTAAGAFKDLNYQVAAKTGTAQTFENNHSDNAVFIAYAPVNNPKIAVAIVIERGVYGSYTAPIANDIFKSYIK